MATFNIQTGSISPFGDRQYISLKLQLLERYTIL